LKNISKIKALLVIFLLSMIFTAAVYSQNAEYIINLYENNRLDDLRNILKNKDQSAEDIATIFLKALLEEDADFANNYFLRLANLSSLYGEFSNLRRAQYNYVLGNYKTTKDILNNFLRRFPGSKYRNKAVDLLALTEKALDENPSQRTEPEVSPEKRFVIQLGVFGVEKNARDIMRSLEEKGITGIYIMEREVQEKKYFLVRLRETMTKEDARTRGEELKRKFGIPYYIAER